MNLWYLAQEARGTLPARFAGKTTVEIARELGVGCHANGSDGAVAAAPEDNWFACLTLGNNPDAAYRVRVNGLQVQQEHDGDDEFSRIATDAGEITVHRYYTPEMKRNGISAPFAKSRPIRSADDFEPMAQVFDRVTVEPNPDGYRGYRERVGEQGLAIARGPGSASPLHKVLHELSTSEQFFYLYTDHRDALYRLAERITPYYDAVLDCLVACDAEAVLWGANFDQDLTWPAFFEKEISPWLQRASERLHAAGKLMVSHCDGENDALMSLLADSGIDVAESVCPYPMTKCTLREIRSRWAGDVAVYGGIPSVALLPASMDDRSYASFMDQLFDELGSGERLILGVSDMVPPDADLDRLEDITRRVEEFGAVVPQ
jgi:hypothetical protein